MYDDLHLFCVIFSYLKSIWSILFHFEFHGFRYDFKVDWWDGDYSLEEKRRTLKDSWRVHRMLGTKAAVETAISAIYPNSAVKEWFEYGGRPYYFKLEINATGSRAIGEKLFANSGKKRYNEFEVKKDVKH